MDEDVLGKGESTFHDIAIGKYHIPAATEGPCAERG
jgi:hypothetical protein